MNLFSHIANAPAAKSPLAEAASLGNASARSEQNELGPTEFSKYFKQLLDAKTPAKSLDTQRQDLAASHALGFSDKTAERNDVLTRDARFDAPNARNSDHRAEPKSLGRQNQQDADEDKVSARVDNADNQHAVKKAQAKRADDAEKSTNSLENDSTTQDTTVSAEAGTGLKSILLSPQVQVITVDSPATSDESLTAFARSMGMADSTIQQLLGGQPQGLTPGSDKTSPLLSGAANPSAPITAWPAGSLLQSLMGGTPLQLPANPLADMSSAGIAANANPMQDLRTALIGGLDQVSLQIGPMASATGSAQTLTTQPNSTLAVLSMLDTQFTPQAIDALQKEFEAAPSSSSEEATENGLSFGAMGVKMGATQGTTTPNAMSASAQATHMAETYEKLSDKLATELAARMHQQISEGQWKMKFALKPASLGAVDIQLEMRDGKLAALFQADNPLTQDLLQNGSQRLKDALHQLGMTQTSVQVGQGQAQAHSQGQSHTSSDTAKFGDNRGQTENMDTNAPADIGHRRASDSQFDIYA
jgi:flagellar hook-length control protein FliK